MKSRGQRITEKVQKSTADEEQKRYILFKKLQSQSAEQFRDIDIDQFDLNITQHVEEAEQIDSAITPLIFSSFFGLKEISKILLKNQRVDVDLETENNGQTPLLTACICGNYEIARLLLLANAEPNKPNYLNQSPLACTLFRLVEEPASFQNKKICFLIAQLLIRHGADPNWIIDKKQGLSLLHYFCNIKMKMNKSQKQLNYDIIKFLLEKGADSRQLTLNDKSCEELLNTHCNKEELLRLLQSYKSKEPVPVPGVQLKPIKKIDANFFSIPKK